MFPRVLVMCCAFAPLVPLPSPAKELLPPDAKAERIVDGLGHGEGPLWHPDGYLLFCDTVQNKILKFDTTGRLTTFRDFAGRTTGLCFDPQGRIVANESHGADSGRRVSRRQADGTWVAIVDHFNGKRFNSPNDLSIDRVGRIYFTDPRYSKRETMELTHESVYRIDPDNRIKEVISTLTRPNGILVSLDQKTLFVSDNPGSTDTRSALWAFDLDASGEVSGGRIAYDFDHGRGIDGMTFDADGRIWATAGEKEKAGIYVLEPSPKADARLVRFIPLPEAPTNCTFGGEKRDTLYITTDASLFRLRTLVQGAPTPPGK
jgi:gluconolactonase